MKKKLVFIMSSLFILGNLKSPVFASGLNENTTMKKEYIISYSHSVEEELIKKVGGTSISSFKYSPNALATLTKKQVKELKKQKSIVDVEENKQVYTVIDTEQDKRKNLVVPNNNMSNLQVNKITYPNWNLKQIKVDKIHNKGFKGKEVKIGIIDSGISTSHFDLKVSGGVNILNEMGSYEDDYGHGTRVAGVIAALDNDNGIKGVAPEANIYSIKVLDSKGEGMISDIISGIEWAIKNEMDIINLSVQTTIENKLFKKTINRAIKKGIIVVAAAGNKGYSENASTITYPAKYNSVISVGALTKKKARADFSSVGGNLDLMAPGEYVYTTFKDRYFVAYSGTSIAAPHVTGTIALMLNVNKNLSQSQVEKILKQSATPMGEKRLYGSGQLNVTKAVNMVNKK